MPLFVAVGLWGVVASIQPHRSAAIRSFRILLVAAASAVGAVMIFGWILERYVADFMPLLVMASVVGMVDIWGRLDGRLRSVRMTASAVISILALFGFVANMGPAISPGGDWTQTQLDHFVQAELLVSNFTGLPGACHRPGFILSDRGPEGPDVRHGPL